MRKPRNFDSELQALTDKAKQLKVRKVQQLGELVIATGADTLDIEPRPRLAARSRPPRRAWNHLLMGLDSVVDRLGGQQMKRVIDLVDDLWDSRKKIVEMVDFVWDHRAQISGVIDFVQDNQERITDVVGRLPELVGQAGTGLQAAGSGAARASALLSGDGEQSPRQLSQTAAEALERCQEQLRDIAGLLADLGDSLDRVRIPTITADRTELMGFSLISGIDIGERPLLDVASKRVSEGSVGLVQVAENLGEVAGRFRRLGAHLVDVGIDLGDAGGQLTVSGVTLRSFVDPDATTTAPKPPAGRVADKPKVTLKKTAVKKTAVKKTVAGKPKSIIPSS